MLIILVPARADVEIQAIRQRPCRVEVNRDAVGIDAALGQGGETQRAERRVERTLRKAGEVIDTRDAFDQIAGVRELRFATGLMIAVLRRHLEQICVQLVEIDELATFAFAIGTDQFEIQRFRE